MSDFFDIAIIGGGASGTILASRLALHGAGPLRVALIEPRAIPGQGVAYSASSVHLLLNVPAGKMSALPEKPEHFHEWLNNHMFQKIAAEAFVPRRLYGYYLENLYKTSLASALPGVICQHLQAEAIDLEFLEKQNVASIKLSNGASVSAKKVVLALGNLPGEYPVRKALPFYHSTRYIHQPWKSNALDDIQPTDTVLLVGTGLTAVDITVQLINSKHQGPIHSLSRRGILPHPHQITSLWNDLWLKQSRPASIREWMQKVRNEIRQAQSQGTGWRAVLDTMRPYSFEIWKDLPHEERSRFLRHLRPYWEVHRHRLAPAIAEQIVNARNTKRFSLHAGRIVSFEEQDQHVQVVARNRKTGQNFELLVHHVINCTGPRSDITKFQHPLLINLLASGLIYNDPLALGINATPEGAIIGFQRPPSDWLFTLGTPLKGIRWESTAIPEIRNQAATLTLKLLSPIND